MRVSFDVDGLLVSPRDDFPVEKRIVPFSFGIREAPRSGTRKLFHEIRRLHGEVWIYTSSTRSALYVRMWLFLHGIKISGVVNADVHNRALSGMRFSRMPSKYPPAFGIDLHVDDAPGVAMEGKDHGFEVVVIEPANPDWVNTVLAAVTAREVPHGG